MSKSVDIHSQPLNIKTKLKLPRKRKKILDNPKGLSIFAVQI